MRACVHKAIHARALAAFADFPAGTAAAAAADDDDDDDDDDDSDASDAKVEFLKIVSEPADQQAN